MKTKLFLSAWMVFQAIFASAQTYTELSDGRWGQGISFVKPAFTDLDDDGLLDMIVGKEEGTLNHYEQDAAGSTTFTLLSENYNGIDVAGYSAPAFTDLEGDGLLDMIVGNRAGKLSHYEQNTAGSTTFTLLTENFNGIDVGGYSAPGFTDLDGNGLLDMIVGEDNGNLNHYEQNAAGSTTFTLISESFNGIDVGYYSTPVIYDLDGDGLLDMIVGDMNGKLNHREQDTAGSTTFNLISDNFNGIYVGGHSAPGFTDLDGDGLLDLIIGEEEGNLNHYEQNAAGSTAFTEVTERLVGMKGMDVGTLSAPCIADLDNDGLLDMIVGEENGNLNHYEQSAAGSTAFNRVSENFNGIDVGVYSTPCFTDLDGDGLLDLIVGNDEGSLCHCEQDAAGSTAFSLITASYCGIAVGENSKPLFCDINGHEIDELLIGEGYGGIRYFQRDDETGIGKDKPFYSLSFRLFPNYPNPFNPETKIVYTINKRAKISLKIFNSNGQLIRTLVDKEQSPGDYEIRWDGFNEAGQAVPSGVYIYQMGSDGRILNGKAVLVK